MTWRTAYRQGSFRGVQFRTQESEHTGGRRGITHEFPERDRPFTEDMGRRAREFRVEVYVAGEDCHLQRDRLIAALEAGGAGTLIHPWHGTQTVLCTDFASRESTDEGGVVFFSIRFVEAGTESNAPATFAAPDTRQRAVATADRVVASAPATFAAAFDVSRAPAFVEAAATGLLRGTAAATSIAGGLLGGGGPALHAFDAGLRLLPDSAVALVRNPLALGQAVVGMIHTLTAIGGRPLARTAALASLLGTGDERRQPSVSTPARDRERDNATAWYELVDSVVAAELVRSVAAAPLTSHADASHLRDAVGELLDRRVLIAVDAGDDAAAKRYAELRRAIVADITRRGGTLARVFAFTPARTEPWLVIAQRFFGPGPALAERAADLVERNRLAHPGFVAGGAAIEVLAAETRRD